MAKITFYGGAGSVTGANFLFESGDTKILVDCGTNERENICDPVNHEPFTYDVKDLDAVIVTHAHQDHIGRVPKLTHEGLECPIYSTPTTRDLSAVMFEDAVNVMHHDAERNHCTPIYEAPDYQKALSLWKTYPYHEPFQIGVPGQGDVTIEFLDAGHILGSSMVRISKNNRSIIFTGDLGNSPEPLLNDTESAAGANYLLMETVYGDRLHEGRSERTEKLRKAIEDTRLRNGTLLVPSFSVERTQIILFEIHQMIQAGTMAQIPVYLDSPLATRVTEVFRNHREDMNPAAQKDFADGDIFSFPGLTVVHKYDDAIHKASNPKVIIAGAGMSSGGRIRAHEKRYLPDGNATILFSGYQAPGSLGRRIQDGQKMVKIDNENVKVRAKVDAMTGYSGHRDRDGLMQFVESAGPSLEKVFCVMGEPRASNFFAQRVKDFLGIEAVVPQQGQTVEISL